MLKLNGQIIPRRTMRKLTKDELMRPTEIKKRSEFNLAMKEIPHSYQYYETLVMAHKKGGRVETLGTRRYMTGVPGAWGGYNDLTHGPHIKEGPPPSRETILRRLGLSREGTKCFKGLWKNEPFQFYSDWCLEEENRMPFRAGAVWSGFKEELPSLESWGPALPTTTKAFTLLRLIVERCFITQACLLEQHEVIINIAATKINDVRS